VIGHELWGVGLVSIVGGFIVLTFLQVRSTFPADGTGATDEKTILANASFDRTVSAATQAVKGCGWKLIENKPEEGYLKAKIGRSVKTLYGQSFTVKVKSIDEKSSSIDTQCSTLYQLMDYGRNSRMIEKFSTHLSDQLKQNN